MDTIEYWIHVVHSDGSAAGSMKDTLRMMMGMMKIEMTTTVIITKADESCYTHHKFTVDATVPATAQ